jgi:hypothetical protein
MSIRPKRPRPGVGDGAGRGVAGLADLADHPLLAKSAMCLAARRDRTKVSSVSDKCVDQLAYRPLIDHGHSAANPSANHKHNNRKGNTVQRMICAIAIILSFAGAAMAQTTSSGGQPAGNQSGTNMSNTYNHSTPSGSAMGDKTMNNCSGSNGSMAMNQGSMGHGTTGTGPGAPGDCSNAGGTSGGTSSGY